MKLIRNKLTSSLGGFFSGKKYALFLSKTKSFFFPKDRLFVKWYFYDVAHPIPNFTKTL